MVEKARHASTRSSAIPQVAETRDEGSGQSREVQHEPKSDSWTKVIILTFTEAGEDIMNPYARTVINLKAFMML